MYTEFAKLKTSPKFPAIRYCFSLRSPAQVLQTVTEDNNGIVQEICSSPQYLSQLEALLQETPTDEPLARSQRLLMRTCIAGNDD
jgi:hypothetical protein